MNRWPLTLMVLLLTGCPAPDITTNQPTSNAGRYPTYEEQVPYRQSWVRALAGTQPSREQYLERAQRYNAGQERRQQAADANARANVQTEVDRLLAIQALSQRTNVLHPGMTPEQVRSLIGEPLETQFGASKTVWKYLLIQSGKAPMPYYLIFEGSPRSLTTWYADQEE
jgi:SmpA / OmlA family